MSGICGIVNFDGKPVDPTLLRRMAEAAAYRGPDGINYWIDGNVGLAHLALHTTPESLREEQPLVNRRGDLVLTADARVDNRRELIRTLTAKGYLQAEDPTDADLILAAYECWGEKSPEHVIGDYAFVIWDARRQILFCARDAIGSRPLCYSLVDCGVRFGSDVHQVLEVSDVKRDLDGYAISDYLTYNFRYRSRTMFATVQNLLPGHCMVLTHNDSQGWRHWNPGCLPPIHYRVDAEYVEHFGDLFFRCMEDRLRSVKGAAAIMTSGGMDSPSIASSAQHLYTSGQVSTQPVAYTYIFDTLEVCDEREYSRTLLSEIGIEMHEIQAEDFHILDDEEADIPPVDYPMPYESLIRYLLRQAQERGCDLLMTGDGGDSLFDAGKFQYVDDVRSGRWWKLWPWVARGRQEGRSWMGLFWTFLLWPLLPARARYRIDKWRGSNCYRHVPCWTHSKLKERTRPAERLYQHGYPRQFDSHMRQLQYESIVGQGASPFIDRYNARGAQYGMTASFPLLDRRLAEFVLRVPLRMAARPGHKNRKWILREAMRGILPEKVRGRPDKPSWTRYIQYMLCERARRKIRALFSDMALNSWQLVDKDILLREFDGFCNGTSEYHSGNVFLHPLYLERWMRSHVPRQSIIQFKPLLPWQSE